MKLADFGVATKLTEADINTHSVVGTPYWMAPEVLHLSRWNFLALVIYLFTVKHGNILCSVFMFWKCSSPVFGSMRELS